MKQTLTQAKTNEARTTATKTPITPLASGNHSSDAAREKKLLRSPRTKKYIQLIKKIDLLDENDKQIIELVKSMPANNKLLGILSRCTIQGCIIHAIDKYGNILSHFKSLDEMSADLQAGFHVYQQHPDCSSVEIYTSNFCVIYDDGTVKFIEREV